MFEQTFSVGDRTYPGDDFRWSNLIQRTGDDLFAHMRGPVFEWIKEMDDADQERMRDAVFLIPNVNLLTRAMKTIDTLFVNERNQDTLGDIYENLLKEIAVAGKNGQFRTPRHLIRVDVRSGRSQVRRTHLRPGLRHRRLSGQRLPAHLEKPHQPGHPALCG